MTQTLFGGVIVIALIYFGLRLAGVSNYWRGVISGLIPMVGMLAYSMNHWPGGDAMTLHIAIYVATATVLTLGGSGKKTAPGQRIHWIPALMIGFFITLAVLMAAFLSISMRGLPPELAKLVMPNAKNKNVYTAFSGEVPHDEEAAKTISQYLKKTDSQRHLGWQIEVAGLDGLFQSQPREVSVTLRDKGNQLLEGATVSLSLKRPANVQQREKTVSLQALEAGKYHTRIQLDQPGQWISVLQIERGQDKYETAKEILVQAL
jgi:nitrogen fixation protein FixH